MSTDIGFPVSLNLPYDQALEKVTAALKVEGFGVLTRIDIQATFKEKLGAGFRPYTILGACNPTLSYQVLSAESEVGLLLPCNVTVEETMPGKSLVRIVNPLVMMTVGKLGENSEVRQVAQAAYEKLQRVAQSLG
jgi:uncharacterized protein (DUF302 family)